MKAHTLHQHWLRTRLILFSVVPALLPLGAMVLADWIPDLLARFFFFTKGWVAWTMLEYSLHRWGFHMHYSKGGHHRADPFNHVHHHTHPADMRITQIAKWSLLFVSSFGVWAFLYASWWMVYAAGFVTGLSLYSCMHWLLHQPIGGKWFPNLVRQHIWHHCKYPHLCFGISTTFWDRIFKTLPEEFDKLPERMIRYYYADSQVSKLSLEKLVSQLNYREQPASLRKKGAA